jgi:PRTRC genetic system protein B
MITGEFKLQSAPLLKLDRAILLYSRESQFGLNSDSGSVATIHEVRHGRGAPTLGAGELLSVGQIEALINAVYSAKLEFFDEHILARGPTSVAWWVPAQRRALFFTTKDEVLSSLNGKAFPQPPLVMFASRSQLYIWAMRDNQRPTAKTALYRAPYYNTSESGNVCLGSTVVPSVLEAANITKYADAFFASAFTHASGKGKLLEMKGSYGQFWRDLEGRDQFPTKALVPTKLTLKNAIQSEGRA